MKFVLEINLERIQEDPAAEPGCAGRNRGGAAKQLDLTREQRGQRIAADESVIGLWELRHGSDVDLGGHQPADGYSSSVSFTMKATSSASIGP